MKLLWLVCIAACSHDPERASGREVAVVPDVVAVAPPSRSPPATPRPQLPDDSDDDAVASPDDDNPHVIVMVRTDQPGDRDGDSIPDVIDKCPDDPEDVNGFEDIDGCPDPQPADQLIEEPADPGLVTFTL